MEVVNYLSSRNTGFVGTLRHNRAREGELDKNMTRDEVRYFSNQQNKNVMLTIWFDSIIVKTLSNCIEPINIIYKKGRSSKTLTYRKSPLVFKEYNKKSGGVDLSNRSFMAYRITIGGNKWWMYIFNYYFQVSINNAYIIYKLYKQKIHKIKTSNVIRRLFIHRKDFMLFIIRELLKSNGGPKLDDYNLFFNQFHHRNDYFNPEIVKNNDIPHFLQLLENTLDMPLCSICKLTKTRFYCKECGSGVRKCRLCVKCHERSHIEMFQDKLKSKVYSYI